MPRLLLCLAAVTMVFGSTAARTGDPQLLFEKYQLSNGLTVILSEDHRLPQVDVEVWYHVGAANQAPGRSGFAHLFEHMMFSGSKHVQPSPVKVLESIGVAVGSQANASTTWDSTRYFEVVPSEELATALWIESDRMGFLLDTLDAQKLAVQRDVVSNERRQVFDNRPYGPTALRICDLLYPPPHPYTAGVIGRVSEIQAAGLDDLRDFFREWYGANNAALAIVGDFDPQEARTLVERYFGPLLPGVLPARPDPVQPRFGEVRRETVEDPLAQVPRMDLVWNGVRPYTAEDAAGALLAEILAGSTASRLHRSLVFDRNLASSVRAQNVGLALGGWFQIVATARAGVDVEDLRGPIQAVLDDLKKNGPTPAEVARAQRQHLARLIRNLESIRGRAAMLGEYQVHLGDPGWLAHDLARYRAVTPRMVRDFANTYLPDDRRLEISTVPRIGSAASPLGSRP